MTQKEIQFPTRMLLCKGDVRGAENLTKPIPLQNPTGKYPARPWAELRGKCALLFDFGREMRGGVRIVCHWLTGVEKSSVQARLRFGESAAECCAELGERGASNDHAPRDFSLSLAGMSSVRYGETGFRFARLDMDLPAGACLNLLAVAAEGEILSLPVQYTYSGKDPSLSGIYKVAKRTVDLCAAGDYVWDGIKRDRLVWIGDMHPEMLALTTLYGRLPSLENSILFMKDTTPPDTWMCNIVTYSAWWLTTLADYCEITGATDFAAPLLPYAQRTVRHLLSALNADGEFDTDGRLFVDWPTKGKEDEEIGARAILLLAAKKTAALFSSLAYPTNDAVQLIARLQKKPLIVKSSMQVVGLKYMATGALDPSDVAILRERGARGMSTFMSYYILTAYARYLGKDSALAMMKEYYGGMLSRGATTFFEDFDLAWLDGSSRIDELPTEGERDLHGDFGAYCYLGFRHSLCHGWSAGVLRFMKDCGV
ncbi:MAG: alpha-L-rhamnosidase [Clostridia bacterium]|nr:alpha-L-rhamnosidase [Clostridia bacterium]